MAAVAIIDVDSLLLLLIMPLGRFPQRHMVHRFINCPFVISLPLSLLFLFEVNKKGAMGENGTMEQSRMEWMKEIQKERMTEKNKRGMEEWF